MYHRTYHEARSAFRAAATKIGAQLEQHKVLRGEDGDELTIDVAIFGSPNPKWTVITSSGLHGVEGFFGSAVQIAFLQKLVLDDAQPTDGQFVFLHALNPFGFAQIRRANENNVDLNRNFLLDSQTYDGAPEGYVQLSKFLNPAGPPRFDFYRARILWKLFRLGLPRIKEAVAGGQYQFPNGIFFGGKRPARTNQIVQENIQLWVCGSHTVHVDFHTGLGEYAKYKLIVTPADVAGCRELFGQSVEAMDDSNGGTAYK